MDISTRLELISSNALHVSICAPPAQTLPNARLATQLCTVFCRAIYASVTMGTMMLGTPLPHVKAATTLVRPAPIIYPAHPAT